MAQGAPSSSPFPDTFTHDVFLSFHGKDTRIGFTGNLYSALSQRGVLTFIDDEGLRKGEEITTSLLKAIRESRMAIVIFSKNYAFSAYCMNELVEIHECAKETGQQIWPIFFDVDPTEVRHQKGTFGEALAKHEQGRFKDNIEKVQKWRLALREVADLSGSTFKIQGKEYEHAFIRKIVDEVCRQLNRPFVHVANYPVGLETHHMQKVQSLLDAKYDNKVNMLGIYGIGGIGKSTVARYIYNLKASQFESKCFLAGVREKSSRDGLTHIQETLLSELVGERNIKLGDVNQGIPILKDRLHRRRVLVILDDVDKSEQLEATAGGLDWFGLGSIIIITTRNEQLLDIHGVEKKYELNKLNGTEALELLRWNAFKSNKEDPSYKEITERAIHYADGLPLALEIIGSNLSGKTVAEWGSALKAYESIPNINIQSTLRVSYDDLEENEKDIFLDIACFFKGRNMRYVTSMLHARGYEAEYGIGVLEKKSLIKILKYDGDEATVTMHDLIQQMGREIVRQQSTWSPDKRNRLWFHKDIARILGKSKENYKIEAIMLDVPEDKEVHWNPKVFEKMKNLRMLIVNSHSPIGSPKHLPNSLRVLEWWGYLSASLPFDFLPENLIILDLSYSCFQWDKPLKNSNSLSHLIFTNCQFIRRIPDISSSPNLTELCVDYCTNLVEIHDSVGFLDKLQRFSARGCIKLKIVPCGIKLPSLEYLCLWSCSSLDIFPEILEPMEKLKIVDFEGTAIENLPPSMQKLGGLQSLCLNWCIKLNTNTAHMLPFLFPFLETLCLDNSDLKMIPECIKECRFLKRLSVNHCFQLQEIRWLPQNIRDVSAIECPSLNIDSSPSNMLLDQTSRGRDILLFQKLTGERLPGWFDQTCRGNSVCFNFRNGIPDIIFGAVIARGNEYFVCVARINSVFEVCFLHGRSLYNTDMILIHSFFRFALSLCPTLHLDDSWNYAEISVMPSDHSGRVLDAGEIVRWSGVYINRQNTSMQNIQFLGKVNDHSSYSKSMCCNHIKLNSLSQMVVCFKKVPSLSFRDVTGTSTDWDLARLLISRCGIVIEEHLRFVSLVELTSRLILEPNGSCDVSGQDIDQASLEFLKDMTACLDVLKAQETISSSDKVSGELDLNRCYTDESSRNQLEQGQDDEEMEAFYASLDAGTHVSSLSHDKPATTVPSEDARESLKIVQDLISNDASIFLHPEQCSVMKTSLYYLSNLSEDDGLSREMIALISEASREFTCWRKDYTEASKKIESTASELLRADKLDADLEDNKKQFVEIVALENELRQNLAWVPERKKELEDAIEADIASSQSEKSLIRKRKRDIFEEGKTLKTQIDEWREKVLQLKHEQGLAKRTQEKIKAGWSKLGDKFKKIIVE